MKRVLLVGPTFRDRRELSLPHVVDGYEVIFFSDGLCAEKIFYNGREIANKFDPPTVLKKVIEACKKYNVDGVAASDDFSGSLLASMAAKALGLPGASPEVLVRCQHKYYSRLDQQKYVPEATTTFSVINPKKFEKNSCSLEFPVFIKPVKSKFSLFANRCNTLEDLARCVEQPHFPDDFLNQFNWFLKQFGYEEIDASHLIVEQLLNGHQVTLEGCVYNKDITIFGVTDSHMFPGTISFKRLEYPSCLAGDVQERMANVVRTFVTGIGLDNTLFNIEFMYNPETDAVHIIEINPRMSSQFADLYEKVDGINTYRLLLDCATGKKPIFKRGHGPYNVAASCVLRTFEDKKLVAVPRDDQIKTLEKKFPGVRYELCATPGKKLSQHFQDGKSFRYGLVHLGAQNQKELLEKFEYCKRVLDFQFRDI